MYRPSSLLPYPKAVIRSAVEALLDFVEGRRSSRILDPELRTPQNADTIQFCLRALDDFLEVTPSNLPTDPVENSRFGLSQQGGSAAAVELVDAPNDTPYEGTNGPVPDVRVAKAEPYGDPRHLIDGVRKTPDIAAIALVTGEMCVELREQVRGYSDRGVFSDKEVAVILEFLPQAIHAMALERLGFRVDSIQTDDPSDPTLSMSDQLFEGSRSAMLATGIPIGESLTQKWLAQWELTDAILSAFFAADEILSASHELDARDFLIWKYFADWWSPSDADELRKNGERAKSRSHKIAFLGKVVRQAMDKA